MSLNAARRRFLTQAGGWAGRWALAGPAALALSAAPASAQMDDLIRQKTRSGGTQPQGGVQGPEPAAIVRQIFEAYRADKIPSVPWSPAVRARMRSADLGADPILQAQDIEVKQFTVRQISRAHDRASVEVRFSASAATCARSSTSAPSMDAGPSPITASLPAQNFRPTFESR